MSRLLYIYGSLFLFFGGALIARWLGFDLDGTTIACVLVGAAYGEGRAALWEQRK